MTQLLQTVLDWCIAALAAYGYRIVLAATTLENLFVVGSFTPGDVITAAAGMAATTDAGEHLNVFGLVGVATAGSLLGANLSYLVGLRGGRELVEQLGPRFGIGLRSIEAAEEYFERHGSATVFLSRFVAVFKNVVPALAGATRMNLLWFELYSALSALVYSSALVTIGWFLGENYRVGLKYFGAASWLLFAALAVAAGWLWLRKRRREAALVAAGAEEWTEDHPEHGEGRR